MPNVRTQYYICEIYIAFQRHFSKLYRCLLSISRAVCSLYLVFRINLLGINVKYQYTKRNLLLKI